MDGASSQALISVNGRTMALQARTLKELLEELRLGADAVVAEVNGRIIAAEDFAATALEAGDSVELVRFVGGG
ncbi:sulfur carrier protein ThiS [Desulfovibrio sp. OttesenSCG-928-A18]|nr:sulfur carrier protein ThiS [Desulfovibrio sp. OttesenSCG-928-A18]